MALSDLIEGAIREACDEGTFAHGTYPQSIVDDMASNVIAALSKPYFYETTNFTGRWRVTIFDGMKNKLEVSSEFFVSDIAAFRWASERGATHRIKTS